MGNKAFSYPKIHKSVRPRPPLLVSALLLYTYMSSRAVVPTLSGTHTMYLLYTRIAGLNTRYSNTNHLSMRAARILKDEHENGVYRTIGCLPRDVCVCECYGLQKARNSHTHTQSVTTFHRWGLCNKTAPCSGDPLYVYLSHQTTNSDRRRTCAVASRRPCARLIYVMVWRKASPAPNAGGGRGMRATYIYIYIYTCTTHY